MVLLRELFKTQKPNDGKRTLKESVLIPEVAQALNDWKKATKDLKLKSVMIGGIALSYYAKPRATQDVDLLFLNRKDIPTEVSGFKRTRPGAFEHQKTGVEIKVLIPSAIKMPQKVAKAIYDEAIIKDGVRIATPAGLIASKLERFKLRDKADIVELNALGDIDLSPYHVSQEQEQKFDKLIATEE
jgi:hypothetical protein